MVPVYQYLGEYEKCEKIPITFPPQHQDVQPGMEYEMVPRPVSAVERERERLRGKTAIITGGDSGIGRAVAYAFAREGANAAIAYLNEEKDALETQRCVERMGQRCILIPGDLKKRCHAREVVSRAVKEFGKVDILVNNHAVSIFKGILRILQKNSFRKLSRQILFLIFIWFRRHCPIWVVAVQLLIRLPLLPMKGIRTCWITVLPKGQLQLLPVHWHCPL